MNAVIGMISCVRKKINIKDRQTILLDSYDKKCIVYLILIENDLYKFGNTDNIKRRFLQSN